MRKEPKRIAEVDGYDLYHYKPTFFDMFGKYYPEKKSLRRRIRFFMALKDGYELFYLVNKKDETVAYCCVQNGKSGRFDFASDYDIIIGPYYVVEKYRGQSLATKLVNAVININKSKFNNAYAYIKKGNAASIKTCEKVGFSYLSDAKLSNILCNVHMSNDKECKHLIMICKEEKE